MPFLHAATPRLAHACTYTALLHAFGSRARVCTRAPFTRIHAPVAAPYRSVPITHGCYALRVTRRTYAFGSRLRIPGSPFTARFAVTHACLTVLLYRLPFTRLHTFGSHWFHTACATRAAVLATFTDLQRHAVRTTVPAAYTGSALHLLYLRGSRSATTHFISPTHCGCLYHRALPRLVCCGYRVPHISFTPATVYAAHTRCLRATLHLRLPHTLRFFAYLRYTLYRSPFLYTRFACAHTTFAGSTHRFTHLDAFYRLVTRFAPGCVLRSCTFLPPWTHTTRGWLRFAVPLTAPTYLTTRYARAAHMAFGSHLLGCHAGSALTLPAYSSRLFCRARAC